MAVGLIEREEGACCHGNVPCHLQHGIEVTHGLPELLISSLSLEDQEE
eukprot:CAMPEP_0179014234 /NCGR_PEP_ID=MMETSP0796-20121207/2144_1 /TAXON_ID=73915 /ORGANISM="Pyrodinium bahamense, Strain pbaha01" /LENGTH=47 /DNA_ID= /DNA_START= /DNA_END= /DNA_ORIENTATION=